MLCVVSSVLYVVLCELLDKVKLLKNCLINKCCVLCCVACVLCMSVLLYECFVVCAFCCMCLVLYECCVI